MRNIKTSFFYAMFITTLTYSWDGAGAPAMKVFVDGTGKMVKIAIDKTVPVITTESSRWAETLLIISERTGVSIDKMTVVVDKLGTGALCVVAGGMTIYSIKLVCNAGCALKSSLWPSEEEIRAKLREQLLIADDIARLQAKKTFEQCLDRHITEPGFPTTCENVAKAYAKFDRYNEVNKIKAFFNQSKSQVC